MQGLALLRFDIEIRRGLADFDVCQFLQGRIDEDHPLVHRDAHADRRGIEQHLEVLPLVHQHRLGFFELGDVCEPAQHSGTIFIFRLEEGRENGAQAPVPPMDVQFEIPTNTHLPQFFQHARPVVRIRVDGGRGTPRMQPAELLHRRVDEPNDSVDRDPDTHGCRVHKLLQLLLLLGLGHHFLRALDRRDIGDKSLQRDQFAILRKNAPALFVNPLHFARGRGDTVGDFKLFTLTHRFLDAFPHEVAIIRINNIAVGNSL